MIHLFYRQNSCKNIVSITEELSVLNLPQSEGSSLTEASPSTILPCTLSSIILKSNHLDVHEPTGFEDFSTEPPKHLLRRSKRIVGTSSPTPSPKKMYVV